MAQIAKIEAKAEITSSAAKVYDFYKNNLNSFVNLFPEVFKSMQLIEGVEGRVGNVKLVKYEIGKVMSVKAMTEEINEGEKSVKFKVIEGDLMQLYNSFSCKISVSEGCVTFCLEFEKINDSAPNPDEYAKIATRMAKILDLYLLTN